MATRLLCALLVVGRVLGAVGKSDASSANVRMLEMQERKAELMKELEAVDERLASLGQGRVNKSADEGAAAAAMAGEENPACVLLTSIAR